MKTIDVCRCVQRLLVVCLAIAFTGCVERRMTVRTDPPSALVEVDGREVGFSPISVPFTYYGNREIRLRRDGYETATFRQQIEAPWYQIFPLDFVSEVLIPWRIRDERAYEYRLEPSRVVSNDEVKRRAEEVREAGLNPPEEVVQEATRAKREREARQ